MIHQWAHDYAEGKWIAVGGGGYAITDVVPHVWTNLVAIVTHQDGHTGLMNQESVEFEKFSGGWDPNNEIDRIIMAIRKGIYPTFGLIADPTASF
jgi:acetoin utilization protein AcuC